MPENNQCADKSSHLASSKFYLLRRLSITSLVVMLVTASVLILLYQRDEVAEANRVAIESGKELAGRLIRSLDEPAHVLVASSHGLDAQALARNPAIAVFSDELGQVLEPNVLKVKVYNQSGMAVYSSAENEIGGGSQHPEWLQSALRGQVESHIELRGVFFGIKGEMRDVNVAMIYMPLVHAGKRIGVFEVYTDANAIVSRIHSNIVRIIQVVLGAFSVLYVALFYTALKADRAIAEWQNQLADFNGKIQKMAFYDALTQLPNRHLLEDRLAQTMSASKRSGRYGALMFLDLDNFKTLNDVHGHGAGDLLLVEAARRISACVRKVDTVARFGGDEFVVVLSELNADKGESIVQAGIVAEKIRAALAESYVLQVRQTCGTETTIEHNCTSSIGVVLFLNHEIGMEDILKRADVVMYQAKAAGRNSIRFYESNA